MYSLGNKAALLTVLLVPLCSAQAQNKDSCLQARVAINVRDREGRFVDGLQPKSFRAVLRGQSVQILSSIVQTTPVRALLLLDVSASMNWSSLDLEVARSLAVNLTSASATPHVALVLFSDHIVDTLGFDRPPNEILQKIAGLTSRKDRTTLFDSVAYAADLFHAPQLGDAIYLISDGGDNHSKHQEKDVEHILLARGIRLFSLILSNRYFMTKEETGGADDLAHLTEMTGGSTVRAWADQTANDRKVNTSLRHLSDLMSNFYEVEIDLHAKPEIDHRWELWVVDENGKRRRDVEVSYPKKLVPCSESALKTTEGQ